MVIGIGTDILKMSGLNPLWLQSEGAFITRTYTQAEIETAGERPDQHTYYAMRFSGKEAVFKALGLSADKVRFNEIEILSDEYGRPYVKLLGRTGCEAAQKCIADVQISLSYDGGFALAYAMAQTE
jgi:phosphopantetheine--protein transferase-like protein